MGKGGDPNFLNFAFCQSYQTYSDFKATNKIPVPFIVTLTCSYKKKPKSKRLPGK